MSGVFLDFPSFLQENQYLQRLENSIPKSDSPRRTTASSGAAQRAMDITKQLTTDSQSLSKFTKYSALFTRAFREMGYDDARASLVSYALVKLQKADKARFDACLKKLPNWEAGFSSTDIPLFLDAIKKCSSDRLTESWKAELQFLCGEKSDGELDRAWKYYESQRQLISGPFPDVSHDRAYKYYKELEDRRIAIETELNQVEHVFASLGGKIRTQEAKMWLRTFSLPIEERLNELCGTDCNGAIHKAWIKYQSEKNSPLEHEALEEYRKLDAEGMLLRQKITLINDYLNDRPLEASFSVLFCPSLEDRKAELLAEKKELCGDDNNGRLDYAWKVYNVCLSLERYLGLDQRRIELEALLQERESPAAKRPHPGFDKEVLQRELSALNDCIGALEKEKQKKEGLSFDPASYEKAKAEYQCLRERLAKVESQIKILQDVLKGTIPKGVGEIWKEIFDHWQKTLIEAESARFVESDNAAQAWSLYSRLQTLSDSMYHIQSILSSLNAVDVLSAVRITNMPDMIKPLEKEILRVISSLEQEKSELCGTSSDGRIDHALLALQKMEPAKKAYEDYQKFEGNYQRLQIRRQSVQTCLSFSDEMMSGVFPFSSLDDLISQYDISWNGAIYTSPFSKEDFRKLSSIHNALHKPPYNPEVHFGYIEKKVIEPNAQIFVRADLHGDLRSLIENLKTLRSQGLLDHKFRCKENVHLVFLGDYVDRGDYSMQVLQLLLTLRMENPGQVTLIRGNHEAVFMNMQYAAEPNFKHYYENESSLLTEIYETMTLSLFIGAKDDSGNIQFVNFTHGMFELYVDPYDMLQSDNLNECMPIPKLLEGSPGDCISARIRALPLAGDSTALTLASQEKGAARKMLKLALAARKMRDLVATDAVRSLTAYNWGDMSDLQKVNNCVDCKIFPEEKRGSNCSYLGDIGLREWFLSPEDVKHYLRLISSENARVKLVFRGHEHLKQHHTYNDKIVVTTLPVAMDGVYTDTNTGGGYAGQQDTGYILMAAPKVSQWSKQTIIRKRGGADTHVTDPCNLRDQRF